MTEKCKQGIRNKCPYLTECPADSGEFESADSRNYELILVFADSLTEYHKPWSDEKGLYACLPKETEGR